jgi:protein SCO1/2
MDRGRPSASMSRSLSRHAKLSGMSSEQQSPGEEPDRRDGGGRRGAPLAIAVPLLVGAAIVASVTALLVTQHSSVALPHGAHSKSVTGYDGQLVEPQDPAPSFGGLRNYLGEPVDLASYRGKAVFVTFLYTHCPDVCPLIAAQLHNTLAQLGPSRSRQLQIVAVSVDPKGDTPETVAKFLKVHGMTGRMKYLIGDARQLGPVWRAWNVASTAEPSNPEFVAHSALIYGISASGKLTTIYPANFQPGQIVHDLSKLLES